MKRLKRLKLTHNEELIIATWSSDRKARYNLGTKEIALLDKLRERVKILMPELKIR